MNVYINLTTMFNQGRLRTILSSGQAVVFHRLAIMSKDGDWIIREDAESTGHILAVLDGLGARYRFGAPLDTRWLTGGWSSHFECLKDGLRVRTDFVSRPPRISVARLKDIWTEQEGRNPPVVNLPDLAELKKTNREKDYAIIGELSRKMEPESIKIRYSRSAREILIAFEKKPDLVRSILDMRGIPVESLESISTLEAALDAERRALIHANEDRLDRYVQSSFAWRDIWKDIENKTRNMPLVEAHRIIVDQAQGVLPEHPHQELLNG